ncbi:MAG: HAMP domain-containing protein [Anaerolineae bacterium]|nr:HAMP domain-containing protein [Anaerolineae bacterium]
MSIRFKVILPYLLLTLIVAVTGAYVVTRLVSNSLQERLANQLLEAGRVVSDTMARQEVDQFQAARVIAFTRGVSEAIRDGELEQTSGLVEPAMSGLNIESLMVFNAQGAEVLHLIKQSNGVIQDVTQPGKAFPSPLVEGLLEENDPNSLPKRELGTDPVDGRHYYFTSIPVVVEDRVVGVVVAGTSLNALVPRLKAIASADVIFYDASGQAVASTFGVNTADPLFLRTFTIEKTFFDRVINQDGSVEGENFEVDGRMYRSGFGPLKISNDRIAVFAVILPLDFVVESSSTNRNTYIFLYSLAMIAVILIGYLVARLIINPLMSLVRTSRAIAGGDLTKRTGVQTNDEIGVLANTFDEMTDNLQQRTLELEKTNQILEQMDRTKMRFIQVSAHELRTPLTLIQGYAQMIEMKSQGNKNLEKYANGILNGTTRMVEIVDSMLDVSRIDTIQLELLPSDMELATVVENVRLVFEVAFEERDLAFSVDGLASLPAIQADKGLIYKVFYHLIMNAIKYTPDGGSIKIDGRLIEADPNKPEVEIAVRDTGIGIDPKNQELVFEKFYQTGDVLLHSSSKTKFMGGGPGLGLASSRGIVNAHAGHIWLESPGYDEENHPGTTVFMRLPVNGNQNESARKR